MTVSELIAQLETKLREGEIKSTDIVRVTEVVGTKTNDLQNISSRWPRAHNEVWLTN